MLQVYMYIYCCYNSCALHVTKGKRATMFCVRACVCIFNKTQKVNTGYNLQLITFWSNRTIHN